MRCNFCFTWFIITLHVSDTVRVHQHYPHGHPNHIVPRFNVHITLGIGLLHPTRVDTHWWLPLQFCVLLLKMDMNRVRNM